MKIAPSRSTAFSLVEVALALGISSFCLLTLLGLIPAGIYTDRATVSQTTAAGIAASILADLRTTGNAASPTSPQFQIQIPASSTSAHTLFLNESGTATVPVDTDADVTKNPLYRARIEFAVPTAQKNATAARIWVTWPALSDPLAAAVPSKYSGSYEVVTSLNRN